MKHLLFPFLTMMLFFAVFAVPTGAASVTVSTATELAAAIENANSGGPDTILLQDGTYTLNDMLIVTADQITVRSVSGNRTAVIVEGAGMTGGISHIFNVAGSWFTASDMTLRRVANHAVQIHGESGTSYTVLRNIVFQDTFEQMVKISYESGNPNRSAGGLVDGCLFEYTAGIGPQWYIGGVDGHWCDGWTVRDCVFRDIQSPEADLAEFAVHFWSDSEDTLVERNLIINCDRGIGFGLGDRGHINGVIRNNMIYHDSDDTNADVGIGLESCINTAVYNNTVYFDSVYQNAIEYRFEATTGVRIHNNLCNKAVTARDDATGTTGNNIVTASASWFTNVSTGDLHLNQSVSSVVDQGIAIAGLTDDFDGDERPFGAGIDIGADEWGAGPADMAAISLTLNSSAFFSGDPFLLEWTGQASSADLTADVYVLLGVAGSYWFWPSWSMNLDHSIVTVVTSEPTELTILDFTWPQTPHMNVDIQFLSILFKRETFDIRSNLATVEAEI